MIMRLRSIRAGAWRVRAGLVLFSAASPCGSLAGQQVGNATSERAGDALRPTWSWTAQRLIAEIPRGGGGTQAKLPDLLATPRPRLGLFWTAGNPGAMAWEVTDRWSEARIERSSLSGDYRRPLDPGRLTRSETDALGWRPVGSGGVAGRLLVSRDNLGSPAASEVALPYSSNPNVVIDTVGAELNRTAVGIEGAGGWRVGPVGLGLTLAYETHKTTTDRAAVPRLIRGVTPSVAAGAAVEFPAGIRAGLHGRWQRVAREVSIFSVAGVNRVYELDGFGEPRPRDVAGTFYRRRMERNGTELILSFSGGLGGARWAVFAGSGTAEDGHWSQFRTQDPPTDSWNVSTRTVGASAASRLLAERLQLFVTGRWTSLQGESTRVDPANVIAFRTNDRRLQMEAFLHYAAGPAWRIALRTGADRDSSTREDLLARATADLRVWRTFAALEAARDLPHGVSASLAWLYSYRSPSGRIPPPETLGPVYREWVGPGLAVVASAARTVGGSATIRWSYAEGPALWVRATHRSSSPAGADQGPSLRPNGERTRWRLEAGLQWGPCCRHEADGAGTIPSR